MTNLYNIIKNNVNGATFISIDTCTTPRLKGGKKNPFKGRTVKIMEGASVMVFQNKQSNGYENMVRRRLIKEGKNPDTFVLSPRKWGTRIEGTPFIEHKGKYYLEVIFLKSGKVHYEVDGVETDPSEIEGLETFKEEADQGGLNDKVIIRTFKVESISSITINKNRYTDLYVDIND